MTDRLIEPPASFTEGDGYGIVTQGLTKEKIAADLVRFRLTELRTAIISAEKLGVDTVLYLGRGEVEAGYDRHWRAVCRQML